MKQPASCPLLRGSGSGKAMQSWDTFLDFSRLMEPRVGWKIPICKRRLLVNIQSFALNYIQSAFMGMVFVGFLLFNQRIVLASLLVTAVYHLGLLVPALAPDLALPTTSEKAAIMSIVGNAVFHWLSVWRLGTVLATAIGLLIVGHALGRPVPGELEVYYNSSEETETVEFDLGSGGAGGGESCGGSGGQHGVNGMIHRRRPNPAAVPGTAVKMTSLEPSAAGSSYMYHRSAKAD